MVFYVKNIVELKNIAEQLLTTAPQNNIWIFEGEMGAGKTTLIKEICRSLGVFGNVQSPTFSIVNEYFTENEEIIYHFDFYRLENETEALDIGIEEYFYSGDLCLIEWAKKIPNLIPKKFIKIKISVLEDESRKIELIFT
ncbi:MAG: tRNA (adenosine(37)-N6)-threonylcarbamoyltransferase complex ATPase subunit type 1 TsaE [Spirosomaceae bacterium]|jgi:tRNA threonylcarbamoyladenosine biosynthesis protein TsaE|nr:tRNA (adenosine(37)-N6)-threonylcarbamoyltransferase complex ATPase subunit type 1 TsaE [Spirosomataceae bacterium]